MSFEVHIPNPHDSVCGWCGKEVALILMRPPHNVRQSDSGPGGQRTTRVAALYLCPRQKKCNRPVLAFFDVIEDPRYGVQRVDTIGHLPVGSAVSMEELPKEIERDRQEAWSSLYAGNLRAAIIMARAAIQRAARFRKAEGPGLKKEISSLVQAGVITQDLGAFAHEVRIAGDDAAHPDTLGEVSLVEAEESLQFLDDFLRVAVAMPARAARRQAERRRPAPES